MAYGDFKDLPRRTAADKVLRDNAFNIAKKSEINWISTWVSFNVYKLFNKQIWAEHLKMKIF